MIYPQKISNKKIEVFVKVFVFSAIMLSIALLVINYMFTPGFYWSYLCIVIILYVSLTVRYSVAKGRNISGFVLFQTILLTLLMYAIDYLTGNHGWSISISIPILMIIANIMMFVLMIINHNHFGKYVMTQLIIVFMSLSIIYIVYLGFASYNILINISVLISIINFVFSLIFCHKDFKEELKRKVSVR